MTEPSSTHSGGLEARAWLLLPALGTIALLWLLHAELLTANTLPASYDLTGHILPIAELKQRLLPHARLHGWSNAWFTGFPLFYFYFPLPALLTVALSLIVSLEVALKLTSVLGVLAFPFALYSLFRALAATRAHAAMAATVAATFLLMQSFWFLGGNIASTLAGEFAMSISFTLSLLYLATLLRASGRTSSILMAAALLAAVALSHLVTTLTVVAVAAVLLKDAQRRRTVLLSWAIAFLLAAFWTVPFLLRHGELAEVYTHAQRSFSEVMPLELWPVVPAAVAGAIAAFRFQAARPLLYITAAGIVLYLLAGDVVYPGRFLPYWYLGLHMLAGYAIAELTARLLDNPASRQRTMLLLASLLLPLLLLNGVRGTGYLRDWSQATFAGLQRRDSWPELQTLLQRLEQDSGRVFWEQAPDRLAELGSRNLAAATPYLAPGQTVLNGLWLESAQVHAELVAVDSGIARAAREAQPAADAQLRQVLATLHALGATRFIALNAATAQLLARNGAQLVHTSPRLALFRLPDAARIVTADGAAAEVLEWAPERVRFRTSAVGVPHLVRISYFPNWRARGAADLRAGEHSMLQLTPQQQEVELTFASTWVETLGAGISILTILGLTVALTTRRLRQRRGTPGRVAG